MQKVICTLRDISIYDVWAKRLIRRIYISQGKEAVLMIPIALMMIEDETDRDFITGLFLKNERCMYAMALKIVKEPHTACDMVIEACLKMIDKISYLKAIDAQKQTPYILSIVKNTALMYLRQQKREKSVLVDDERILDCVAAKQEELDAALISEAEGQMIRQALKRLKTRDRDLLEMKYFHQMDDEIISRQLRISRNSVRYYLTLARRALRDELGKVDG